MDCDGELFSAYMDLNIGSGDCGRKATKKDKHMKTGKSFLEKLHSVLSGRGNSRWRPAKSALAPWLIGLSIGWAFIPDTRASNPIWINPMTCGTPITTYYLGDSLSATNYVNFEIGQQNWNYAQVGYGTAANGAGYNWGVANWYEDGTYPNKHVRRNIGGLQFTATGNWYLICQAKESSGDTYSSAAGCGWVNTTAYPPTSMNNYFTVSA